MNWKIRFRELTGWRLKNDEERWRTVKNLHEIAYGNVSKALWKRLGLDFFYENNFSHQFRGISWYQKWLPLSFYPLSIIYRRKKGGGCRPACPGEQGCFHQKAPPSFGTLKKTQVGLVAICTPLFTKYTPFGVFLLISFRNVAKLYELCIDACFSFRNVAKLYELRNDACFSFWNVAKLNRLRNDACFVGFEGSKQGSRTDRKYSRMKLGYDSCPSLLIFYWW